MTTKDEATSTAGRSCLPFPTLSTFAEGGKGGRLRATPTKLGRTPNNSPGRSPAYLKGSSEMADLNRVALTGNLTADPQLRGENQNVLSVRLAVTGRRKDGDEWVNTSHFFDVTVFGNRAKALG